MTPLGQELLADSYEDIPLLTTEEVSCVSVDLFEILFSAEDLV